jgi:hypothetical protein
MLDVSGLSKEFPLAGKQDAIQTDSNASTIPGSNGTKFF